ncbi:hypothetical protein [Flavobacterium sp.]|uniref:hypothetical protein n=1 Tax=Flavobacterium sp. TaxID=239 RepID=UPI0012236412|nr:hypothetical protein [Flavobacterium sp.]RZJ71477.1 MAG: DUF3857 domain-containing protein [Flavobacterium sp.]
MRTIYIALFTLFSFVASAQDKEEVREFFWGKDDPAKSAKDVPEKWNNESAVILYKYQFYDYHKFGKRVKYVSAARKRIKLQDAAAVKEFSEFSFEERFVTDKGFKYKKGTNTVGIKIVKPDGKEVIVDVEKESKKVDKENKIAIGNLEVGDIIDFYSYRFEPFESMYAFGFDPVETTLGDEYPIKDFKLAFNTENDFFVNFNTFNGAPELKQIETGKSNDRRYELVASEIPKNDFPRWFYPLVELPCYKFQVYFARSGKFEKMAMAFLPESEKIIKKDVTKEDIMTFYNKKYYPFGDLGQVEKFLKDKKFESDEEKLREVYYFTRHMYYTRYLEAIVAEQSKIFPAFQLYGMVPQFLGDEEAFIKYFMAFMKDNKIDYDIILCMPRYDGPISGLLIEKDIKVIIRANTAKPMYLQHFSAFTSPDQFEENLENTEAFVLNLARHKKVTDVTKVTLPGTTKEENASIGILKVKTDADMKGLSIDRKLKFLGHLKEDEQERRLYFFDYVDADYEKYQTKKLEDLIRSDKKQEKFQKEYAAIVNKSRDNQKEALEKMVEDEFDIKPTDYKFSVLNSGRYGKGSAMEVEEKFELKDAFMKKAGENYVLEVGKIIGGQVALDAKDKKRTNNVYMSFPRSFANEIEFEIPSGYTVTGIDKLNKNVVNSAGGFVSSAKIDGTKLVVKTNKYYTNYYEPNANWSKMVEFLEAAFQFTQEKVLLKKA